MLVIPEVWDPMDPTALQSLFLNLAAQAELGTMIAFTAYNPSILLATVPDGTGNTGNGVMHTPVILEDAVEEIWTVIATSATNFTVTGSVSGAQDPLTVGQGYKNNFIAVSISAGTVAFESGDEFTFEIELTNPETEILADGYVEEYKEETAGLNEVIYSK